MNHLRPLLPLVALVGCLRHDDTGLAETGPAETDSADTGPTLTGPIVIYAVRHAEKDTDSEDPGDPGLTEEGLVRAEALVEVMAEVPLAAIYATEYRRTQETVAPTAAHHGLEVIIDYDPEEELAAHILATHADEVVLHAGHSNTLPDFMEALGVAELPDDYEYGDLWILHLDTDGSVTMEESHYGE